MVYLCYQNVIPSKGFHGYHWLRFYPVTAQIALIGTVGFVTISSTTMLHFVTSPYVKGFTFWVFPSEERRHFYVYVYGGGLKDSETIPQT